MIPRWGVAATAAGTTALTRGGLRRTSGPGWIRSNFRGHPVHLGAGPAAAVGAVAGMAVAGVPPRACGAVAVAGGLGLYDDLAGATHARGLGGHAKALARGEVTTGLVKLVGLVAAGLTAAPSRSGHRRVGARLADAALIAGTANLVNLLDLRPGRALKVVGGTAAPLAAGASSPTTGAASALVATVAALLPGDLGERNMIGDSGANALGAALGWTAAAQLGPLGRCAALAAVVSLTLASERISFSAVIDKQPALAALDAWGRRP